MFYAIISLLALVLNLIINRESLMKSLQDKVWENQKSKSGPVLASGMAVFTPGKDSMITEIFDRADKAMYKNKRDLKK